MSERAFDPFEPEETVGKIWHSYASRLGAPASHEAHAVALGEVEGRLGVFFRGLGGAQDTELRAASEQELHHRLSFGRGLGTHRDRQARPSFDGEALRLPPQIAEYPSREINAALYFWLTAMAAHAPEPASEADPLRADIRALQTADAMTRATLAACPGLKAFHQLLLPATREARSVGALPRVEAAVEAAIDHILGGPSPTDDMAHRLLRALRRPDCDLGELAAPRGYRPFRAVPIWPDLRPPARRASAERLEEAQEQGSGPDEQQGTKRARRQPSDLAERRDSLILHRFEAIFAWVEGLNLNRRIEDDDEDSAKRAADDQDELALGQVSKRTATRLRFHLDLAPEDADRERISDVHTYPEWDHRSGRYLPDHCRVLASTAETAETATHFASDPAARRRIRTVKRQFEALRPKRVILPRQLDGDDLDMEAAVSSLVELRATGQGHDRVYRASRAQDRDLAVSVLMDTSRSTESAIGARSVIEVEKEALAALAWGLDACGDDFAIDTFSSLRRDRVYIQSCKRFDEPMSAEIEARIEGLSPVFYTRLGAAIRHVSARLDERPHRKRLLLAITDGKPNDLDHYEGRHGIEDSRMAVREARRRGQAVHGVLVDAKGQAWFSRIFGADSFSIVPDAARLTAALPEIYRQITGTA